MFYHSTDLTSSIEALFLGLGRSFGAGSDALLSAFGFPIGGSFVTPNLSTALNIYPYHLQVGEDYRVPGLKRPDPKKRRPAGACLMDGIGTLPIKPCFRLLGFKSDWLWHRPNQAQFMPKSLYITHLLFCAYPPRYLNEIQRQLAPLSFRASLEEARYFVDATKMLPVHHEYNFEDPGSSFTDWFFESFANVHNEDVHELEVRVQAPRRVLQQLAEEIKAKVQDVGAGLIEPPDGLEDLAAHVDEIADVFVDDVFPSAKI